MSTQPKTTGSGFSLSSVRTSVDALTEWIEALPAPAMIEGRGVHGTPDAAWSLVRIEDNPVTGDREYTVQRSSDTPTDAPKVNPYRAAESEDPTAGPQGHADLPNVVRRFVRSEYGIHMHSGSEERLRRALDVAAPVPDVSDDTRRRELRTIVHDWAVNGTDKHMTPDDQFDLVNRLMGAKS